MNALCSENTKEKGNGWNELILKFLFEFSPRKNSYLLGNMYWINKIIKKRENIFTVWKGKKLKTSFCR